jgi:hypothetical protein
VHGEVSVEPALHPRGFESVALRWVPLTEVETMPLHPGFAASWPHVRAG